MNELALFAGAGKMKSLVQEALWKPSGAANAAMNFRSLRSISAQVQSRITLLAKFVNVQWRKTGMSATRARQQPKSKSGGNKTQITLSDTAPTIDKSITGKNLFANTVLSRNGSMTNYSAKEILACAASVFLNGATSKQLRTLTIATIRNWCAAFSAIDAIPSSGFAKTTTSCYPLWRGI